MSKYSIAVNLWRVRRQAAVIASCMPVIRKSRPFRAAVRLLTDQDRCIGNQLNEVFVDHIFLFVSNHKEVVV